MSFTSIDFQKQIRPITFLLLLTLFFALPRQGAAQYYFHFENVNPRDLDFLREDTTLNLIFNYDNLRVGDLTEQEYIDKKVDGPKDESWLNKWYNDRKLRYQPNFQMSMGKKLRRSRYTARKSNEVAKYTLLVKTKYIEPGWWAYRVQAPAIIVVDFIFYKTDDPSNVFLVLENETFRSTGIDRTTRIARAYSVAGLYLGKFISKEVLGKRKK